MLGASASLNQGVASNSMQRTLSAVWQVAWIIGFLRSPAERLSMIFSENRRTLFRIMLESFTSLPRTPSGFDQIPEQVRRHRQLGECQAAGCNLLDRAADARRFGVSREPGLDGLLAGLA